MGVSRMAEEEEEEEEEKRPRLKNYLARKWSTSMPVPPLLNVLAGVPAELRET